MKGNRFISTIIGGMTAGAMLIGTGFFSYAEEAYRNVNTEEKVYDYADLLTGDEEATIQEECRRLIDNYGYDVFVVTIDDNNVTEQTSDRSLTFLENFGDENDFGLGEEKNYVAFLIDMDERQYSLDIKGDTCFLIYSDEVQDMILDDIYYDMKNGYYYDAVWTFLDNVDGRGSRQVSGFVGTAEEYEVYQAKQKQHDFVMRLVGGFFVSLLIGAGTGAVVVLVLRNKSKTVYTARDASGYAAEGSFQTTANKDQFIRNYKTTRTIQISEAAAEAAEATIRRRTDPPVEADIPAVAEVFKVRGYKGWKI